MCPALHAANEGSVSKSVGAGRQQLQTAARSQMWAAARARRMVADRFSQWEFGPDWELLWFMCMGHDVEMDDEDGGRALSLLAVSESGLVVFGWRCEDEGLVALVVDEGVGSSWLHFVGDK
ncbi:hypothetical protein SESBI_37438 [Sesbania bispinosa]|nr:hypothetical protein SESBI_37438 [Sesbania bispinosa]